MDNECCGMFVGGHTSDKNCPMVRLETERRERRAALDESQRYLSLAIHALKFYANPLIYAPGSQDSIKEDLGRRARSTLKAFGTNP